jgi:hypothetical protein
MEGTFHRGSTWRVIDTTSAMPLFIHGAWTQGLAGAQTLTMSMAMTSIVALSTRIFLGHEPILLVWLSFIQLGVAICCRQKNFPVIQD